jgi:RNA polymerase sigma-70 factor (ECF subfamily)
VGATIVQAPVAAPLAELVYRGPSARGVKPRMLDEDRLIARAASGETAAFRQLYERHRADVARLVYRMLGPRSDMEDVIQEVFVQVYKSLRDFRGQSKFSTWLHRVTVNVVLMYRRAARSRPVFADEPAADGALRSSDIAPDEDAERRERVRAFGRLLDRLADKKRIVFVLHELEGISPGEIAKIVGAPVLTVRTRLFYARREIEAMLAEEPALAGMQLTFSKASGLGGET